VKRCFNCGREDTRGFSKLPVLHIGKGKRETRTTWVCAPGHGCEGIGGVRIAAL
jgi:hypothetical protein